MEENQTPINVNTQVEAPKKSNKPVLVVLIVLVIAVVILSIGIVFLFIQNQNITNTPKTAISIPETKSSTTSSTKTLKFNTFENEFVSFQYPEGWKVVLNEPKNEFTKLSAGYNVPCKFSSDFSGVYNIRLVKGTSTPENIEELEYGLMWGGIGSGGYDYDKTNPLKLVYFPEGMTTELEAYTLTSTPKILPINLLTGRNQYLFSGEYTESNGSKKVINELASYDKTNSNLLYIGDTGFYTYSLDNVVENVQVQKLKFVGGIDCGGYNQYTFGKFQDGLLAGYSSMDESPEDIVKIYETFLSSLVRK